MNWSEQHPRSSVRQAYQSIHLTGYSSTAASLCGSGIPTDLSIRAHISIGWRNLKFNPVSSRASSYLTHLYHSPSKVTQVDRDVQNPRILGHF
jgi:hypothetical protein